MTNHDALAQAQELIRLFALAKQAAIEASEAAYNDLTEVDLEADNFHQFCTDHGEAIARALVEANERLKEAGVCGTCSGTGMMQVLVRIEPPDEREIYADEICAECGGSGVGLYQQMQNTIARQARAIEILRIKLTCLSECGLLGEGCGVANTLAEAERMLKGEADGK